MPGVTSRGAETPCPLLLQPAHRDSVRKGCGRRLRQRVLERVDDARIELAPSTPVQLLESLAI
jgi:hypothetical protein